MKVLKFGGSSVGTVSNILNVKQIVEAVDEQVIVVVSALGGITDRLIKASLMAAEGNQTYRMEVTEMVNRHLDMIHSIIPSGEGRVKLVDRLQELFADLTLLYDKVYAVRRLSVEASAEIVSYGELLSSLIVSSLISGSRWYDSRTFMKTEKKHHKNQLDAELTEELIREAFKECTAVSLVPGFISTDKNTGETTNLGRGGSDYTAAIIAAALDADVLEIWTDVDGFMTGDPRIIHAARPIDELNYEEAIELCNFGAKVVYPPTIHPVCTKNIPILIKNTMNPTAPGTVIAQNTRLYGNGVKGISSIKEISLITVAGIENAVKGDVCRDIQNKLKKNGISSFVLSKPDYHTSVSVGVCPDEVAVACDILQNCLTQDAVENHACRMQVEGNLAMVTVVGQCMGQSKSVADRLFGVLASNEVKVVASSIGESETNLSFMCESALLPKAMNVAHEIFFQELKSYSTAS